MMLFPYHVNHLTLNWHVPLHRGAMQFLARHCTVINLDCPGAGLSAPLRGELSLERLSQAVDAVREAVRAPRLGVCAMGAAGLIACHYAARYPQRVSRLVFIASGESDTNRQLLHLRHRAPHVEAEARGAVLGGVGDGRNARALTAVARASLDAVALAAWERLLRRESLLALARDVDVPALCLHAADDRLVSLPANRALAEHLQNATLRLVPANSGMDVWRDRAAVAEIVRFLRGDSDAQALRVRRPSHVAYPAGLSPREVEVIRLIGIGRTNRQIAEELFVSAHTVSYHLRNIFAKTGASNRTEAATFALESGLASRR